MSDRYPQNPTPWPGADAGMPPPPGWRAPAHAPQRPSRSGRWGIALLLTGLLIASGAGLLAGTSISSGPLTQTTVSLSSASAGIVDITTATRLIGRPTDQLVPEGAGTGMVLTANGEVLTNNHVVRGAWKIEAHVPGGSTYTATVVGVDPTHDVALLQLANASGLATITPGDASTLSIGDQVSGIGNALGRGAPAVASGSVTAVERSITAQDPNGTAEKLSGLIQTNANIQPGDSGGALVNTDGEVVGMITAGNSQSVGGQGQTTGFAIPIEDALSVVNQIQSGDGSSTVLLGERGYLGVAVRELDQATAAHFGVSSGALVVGIDSNSPAENAGMTAPAVIRSVDGQPVTSTDSLGPLLHSHVPGDSVTVTWVDGQGSHSATVQLIPGPAV
jgi:S1-C subfamily serine protease